MAPTKTIIAKDNTNEWFDGEIKEKIATGDKLLRKFNKTKSSVDKIYTIQRSKKYYASFNLRQEKKTFARKAIWK